MTFHTIGQTKAVIRFHIEDFELMEALHLETEHGDAVVIPAGTILKMARVVDYTDVLRAPDKHQEPQE
jgi:hypothetical protein